MARGYADALECRLGVPMNPNAIMFVLGMAADAAVFTMSPQHVLVAVGFAALLSALAGKRSIPLNIVLLVGMIAPIVHGSLQPGGLFS